MTTNCETQIPQSHQTEAANILTPERVQFAAMAILPI